MEYFYGFLEAIASGLAIITRKDTGCAEVVGDAPISVRPRDHLSIRERLIELVNNWRLCEELVIREEKALGLL